MIDQSKVDVADVKGTHRTNWVAVLAFAAIIIFARDWWKLAALWPMALHRNLKWEDEAP